VVHLKPSNLYLRYQMCLIYQVTYISNILFVCLISFVAQVSLGQFALRKQGNLQQSTSN
jgi:hypothetical protein